MRSEIGFIARPPLKRSSSKLAEQLRPEDFEALFLNLPKSIDHLVAELPFGLDYSGLVEDARERKLLPEPVEAWLKDSEPILQRLRSIGDRVLTYCYKDTSAFIEGARTSQQLALLTIRDKLRGRIDAARWMEELEKEADVASAGRQKEFQLLSSEASQYEKNVCIAGLEARILRDELKDSFDTWIKYIDQPYCFTPLEVLRREMVFGKMSRERATKLIEEHIKFVHEYVLLNELDDAYLMWAKKHMYWHPSFREKSS